jgi:hypothetical protein
VTIGVCWLVQVEVGHVGLFRSSWGSVENLNPSVLRGWRLRAGQSSAPAARSGHTRRLRRARWSLALRSGFARSVSGPTECAYDSACVICPVRAQLGPLQSAPTLSARLGASCASSCVSLAGRTTGQSYSRLSSPRHGTMKSAMTIASRRRTGARSAVRRGRHSRRPT